MKTNASLRYYFAAAALQGWIASERNQRIDWEPAEVAQNCYRYADAMLAARTVVATKVTNV